MKIAIIAMVVAAVTTVQSKEFSTTKADQDSVFVTIYNQNLALVKDKRTLTIGGGVNTLAFKDVSAQIRPETVTLVSQSINLLEQNFEYDLLSPQSLLNKYIGQSVTIQQTNPATGEVSEKQALVLANNQGVMLKVGDKIMAASPDMRFIYDDLPKDLRDKPTMTMLINSQGEVEQQSVELNYLTGGLNWKADYVANIVDNKTLNLKGWVTLDNHSGTAYNNASLQLVAGEVNLVPRKQEMYNGDLTEMSMSKKMATPTMQEESLFEYHLYTLDRKTDIKNNQSKQVSLLQASNIPYKKRYVIANSGRRYSVMNKNAEFIKLNTEVRVDIENKKANNLGLAMPKGVIRTYQKDSKGNSQFIGEDSVDHTPENERISLKLGDAFDITATKKQTSFKHNRINKKTAVGTETVGTIESSYEVNIKNAKDEAVLVEFNENIYGEWEITEQSLNSEKRNASLNRWKVNVPAKGETKLTYSIRSKLSK